MTNIFSKLIEYSFYCLFFLIPLIMTPINFELFEFNKMILTYAFTIIIVGFWLAKMVVEKKIIFKRSPFAIPFLFFLISQILSFLFSIDPHTSLWGYYSRFHGGLLSTLSYFFLYFAFVSNMGQLETKRAIKYLLKSATLVSFYGILEHFGIDAKYWVQDVKNRVFSTLGQPNWLAAWLAALIPLSLSLIIEKIPTLKKEKKLKLKNFPLFNTKIIFPLFLLVNLSLCLIYTKSRSGIAAAIICLIFFLFLLGLTKNISLRKKPLIISSFFFTIFLIAIFLWGAKTLFKNTHQDILYILDFSNKANIPLHEVWQPGSESGDIRKVVWRGAIKIWKAYPIFGSGVETFAYSYYNFRPIEHNFVSEWDFLYNKAHNEYLNFLATTGVVGLGTYLLLIGWIIVWSLREIKQFKILNTAIFSGWLSILVSNFFGFSVVPVALLFFLYPAFLFILKNEEEEKNEFFKKKPSSLKGVHYFIIILIFSFLLYLLFFLYRLWYADVLYAKGQRFNKQGLYDQSYQYLTEAINLNPSEPVYHDELALSTANLGVLAFEQGQINLSNQLIQYSLSQSDIALKISPRHLNFYRTRAKIFLILSRIDHSFYQNTLEVLLKASELAPTDPKILYNLGLVYYQLDQKEKAIETLKKTLDLKPNYQEAKTALDLITKK